MIDFLSFLNFHPSAPKMGTITHSGDNLPCDCSECCERFEPILRFSWDQHPPGKSLTDEQILFCPPRVLGYAMKLKKWVQLLVGGISDPEKASDDIFKNLQLEENTKRMIKNLVEAHEEGKGGKRGKYKGIVDFVEDKGKGLVIMLYGWLFSCTEYIPIRNANYSQGFQVNVTVLDQLPRLKSCHSGVGKTLTAEGVARLTRKPLFTIGVSEIGTTSQAIERNLADVFMLASLWKAVLLMCVTPPPPTE